jgi:hypothetical protein
VGWLLLKSFGSRSIHKTNRPEPKAGNKTPNSNANGVYIQVHFNRYRRIDSKSAIVEPIREGAEENHS